MRDDVLEFQTAFVELLVLVEEDRKSAVGSGGSEPGISASLARDTSRLAGRARGAFEFTYVTVTMPDQFSFPEELDPTVAWIKTLGENSSALAQRVIFSCSEALGILDVQIEKSRATERTFTWKLAKFLSWPKRVLEHMGLNTASGTPKLLSTAGTSLFSALLVAVVGGVILGLIRTFIGWAP